MSLLSDITNHFKDDPRVLVGVIERRRQFGSFVVIEIPLVPSESKDMEGLRNLFWGMLPRSWQYNDAYKGSTANFGPPDNPDQSGESRFEEVIGSETIQRTFAVDDAVAFGRETFDEGEQEPVTLPLKRVIVIKLYPSVDNVYARRHFGATAKELLDELRR